MGLNKIKNFYKNKKIFVTGHTGFKGMWLFLILKFLGAKVKGYSLPLKKDDNFIFFKKFQYHFFNETIFNDIVNSKNLSKQINHFKPHIVFHLAAQSLVIESQKNPLKTLETNVLGTNNVIEACVKQKSVRSLVIATSDKCYMNKNKKESFNEDSELGGVEVYSSSKAMCEQLINSYLIHSKKKLHFGLSSVRAGNVIGGGDFSKYRIIPDIIKNSKSKIINLRNPNHIRPWQHVLDVCYGYLIIPIFHYKKKEKYSGPYNIGPNEKKYINVLSLTKKFLKIIGKIYKIRIKKNKFIESKLLLLNSQKIKKSLKWSPLYNFEKSIYMTAIWYKEYLKKKDIKNFTYSQIEKYFNVR